MCGLAAGLENSHHLAVRVQRRVSGTRRCWNKAIVLAWYEEAFELMRLPLAVVLSCSEGKLVCLGVVEGAVP